MKILFDHQVFTFQKYGGISRYFYELVKKFHKKPGIEDEISLVISDNYYLSDNQYVKLFSFFSKKRFKGRGKLAILFNRLNTIYNIKKQKFDIFHPTYYNPYFLKYLNSIPYVITVHDMIHEKYSDMFPITDRTSEQKELTIKNAHKIIAVSENTKKDIIDIYGISEEKISIVYHGNSMVMPRDITLPKMFPSQYILFVGDRERYKNFKLFFEAITPILQNDNELNLICIGGGQFNNIEIEIFNKYELRSQVNQYNVNDSELSIIYANAKIFVFPSLYEGFGIPILEAFSCKCPVVCSNTSAFPEVAKDAAMYFDPKDKKSIYNAVVRTLENENLREDLVKKGSHRVQAFSWEKAAKQTMHIYKEVLGG